MNNKQKARKLRSLGKSYKEIGKKLSLHPDYVFRLAKDVLSKEETLQFTIDRARKGEMRNCVECGKKFYARPQEIKRNLGYCCSKSCAARNRNYKRNEWKQVYKNADWAAKRAKRVAGQCENCGYDKVLDGHHIDLNRANNKLSNLIALCPNCHALIHRGLAKIENRKLIEV